MVSRLDSTACGPSSIMCDSNLWLHRSKFAAPIGRFLQISEFPSRDTGYRWRLALVFCRPAGEVSMPTYPDSAVSRWSNILSLLVSRWLTPLVDVNTD